MIWASMLLFLAAGADPEVEVSTLQGQTHSGRMLRLTREELTLLRGEDELLIPVSQLLGLSFVSPGHNDAPLPRGPRVTLADGTHFGFDTLVSTATQFTLETPQAGRFQLPTTAVANVRFGPSDSRVAVSWDELCARQVKQDLLVVRKGDVLDFLDGTIGPIGEEFLTLIHEGDEIPVRRSKVFGVIYARRQQDEAKPKCKIHSLSGDELNARDVSYDGKVLTAVLAAGAQIEASAASLSSIDFSLGKLAYLSDMEPREVDYTPYFDIVWEYRRDRNLDGGPLRVGEKQYDRGLSIHSRTLLRYRLGRNYRRFQAVVGIDRVVNRRGNVHLVIHGDDKTLFEEDVLGTDEPRKLDLDVSGVRDLKILVDFGDDLDISDHLDLADAKVLK
jgi:hypothetical protein